MIGPRLKSPPRRSPRPTGAFILAATGLLDGPRATTHWLAAPELSRRYPAIDVDPDVPYIDNGNLLTSAGAVAGIDLCLHMIRRDFGAAVALNAVGMAHWRCLQGPC